MVEQTKIEELLERVKDIGCHCDIMNSPLACGIHSAINELRLEINKLANASISKTDKLNSFVIELPSIKQMSIAQEIASKLTQLQVARVVQIVYNQGSSVCTVERIRN